MQKRKNQIIKSKQTDSPTFLCSFSPHCSGIVLCCTFHSQELLLFTGGDDSQVRIWDLVAKSCIATLQGHFSAVTCLSLITSPSSSVLKHGGPDLDSGSGWYLMTGGRDGVVIVWDVRDHRKVATIPVYEAVEGVAPVASSMSALCFATGGEKGVVKLWRADTGECVFDGSSLEKDLGKETAAGGIVELRQATLKGGGTPYLLAATQDCRLLLLRPSSPTAPLSSSRPAKKPKKSKKPSSAPMLTLHRQFLGNNDDITDIKFIPRGEVEDESDPLLIAVATNSEHIRILDVSTLGCVATLMGHTDIVLALDCVRLKSGVPLLASGSKDNTVRVWTLDMKRSSTCVGLGTGHIGPVTSVAFSRKSSGFLLSTGSDKLIKVWSTMEMDLEGGQQKLRPLATVSGHEKAINAVAIAPNDSVAATASQDRSVKIWSLPTLVLQRTLKGHKRGVWAVAFSPVDKAIVTASGDKTVKLWSLGDGSCLRTFEGHVASVLKVDFMSHGAQLLTSGADGLLKLWNMRTSECTGTFDAHEDKVWALSISERQGVVATGGGDGSLVLWEDCTGMDAADAAAEVHANILSEQELSNAVKMKDWKKAAQMALEMNRPGRLLAVVTSMYDDGKPEKAESNLQELLSHIPPENLKQCLEYCRDWNTNGKTCFAAQMLFRSLMATHSPQEILSVPGIGALLDGIGAYTKRHFARVDRLLRSTFLLDYVLGSMKVLQAVQGTNDADIE
jgi:U3 small nucleolar RNA-associated protein 13